MAALSILVTGSSGFIGTHVVRHLHESGHRVTALDCAAPKEELPPGVRFHMCDIREGRKRSTEHLLQFCQRSGGSGSYAMRLSMV
jgi:nucleoside-diphosphate-sugar epimerase